MKLARSLLALSFLLLLGAAGPCEQPPPATPDAGTTPPGPDAATPADAATMPPPSHCTTATHAPISSDPTVAALASATAAFRASLNPTLLAQASFCLEDDELPSWSFLPVFVAGRKGVQFSDLSPAQLDLAYAVFAGFLSTQGYDRLYLIINTLDEMMRMQWGGFGFGAGLYHISLFNDPATDGAWGIQIDGHHLAITFVVDGDHVYTTPAFFGGQPNVIGGVKVFGGEESAAFAFVAALSSEHLTRALTAVKAPNDVVTAPGNGGPDAARNFDYTQFVHVGLAAADMTASERQKLRALIAQVVSYQHGSFAAAKMAEIDAVFDETWFTWMGPTDGSGRFYFRVYSPKILIEYDLSTVVGEATDHTHMLIRSPDQGDFGPFALRTPSLEQHLRSDPDHRRERERTALRMDVRRPSAALAARLAELVARHQRRAHI